MIPAAIVHVITTMAMVTSMSLAPIQPFEPDPAEVTALARTVWAEARGCSELQQRAVCWTVFNRVDSEIFPDTVLEVLSAPCQFAYSSDFPATDELQELARDCLTDWHYERDRVLEPGFYYYFGDGRINHFSTEYGGKGERWEEE